MYLSKNVVNKDHPSPHILLLTLP